MSANRSDMKTFFRTGSVGLLAGCLWFSAGTAALEQDNTAAPQASRTDADIQSDVSYALTHDSTLQGQQIGCTTANGTVTLSGTVQTDAQRQQAETVAANVPGVGGILNNIKVTNPGPPNSSAANAAVASQQAANTPVQPSDDAQSNVPPPPPDMDPNVQGNQNQTPPPAYSGARPPYQPQQQGGYYYPSPPAYN